MGGCLDEEMIWARSLKILWHFDEPFASEILDRCTCANFASSSQRSCWLAERLMKALLFTSSTSDAGSCGLERDVVPPHMLGRLLFAYTGRACNDVSEAAGRLLGCQDKPGPELSSAFMGCLHVAGHSLVAVMRNLLARVRLPGEAMKIERIIQALAERFVDGGGGADEEERGMSYDSSFCMLFSILMLSTDHHNPMVRRKMTEDGFVRPQRGVNDGANFSDSLLRGYYRSVAATALIPANTDASVAHLPPSSSRCTLM